MRLRRLLACTTSEELLQVIRPMLTFIDHQTSQSLSYAHLLDDLIKFDIPYRRESIKMRWAQDFWNIKDQDEAEK